MIAQQSILHIIDTTGPGGAETIFTQLAIEAQKRGMRSIALIRGSGWVEDQLRAGGIFTYVYNCKGSFNFAYLKFLVKLIKEEKVALIQSHLLGSNVYASMAGFLTRVPVISTFHGFVDISEKERLGFAKFLAIRMGSRKVIAVTQQLYTALGEISYFDKNKLLVIPNGIDLRFFPKKESVAIGNPIHIGCLGNVRRAKNYPLAIKMLDELVSTYGFDAYLHIAGDDKNQLANECKQLVNELGLTGRVTWHGFIDSAADYLASLDIYLLSSSSEGHPLALTQAMSVGLPIVVTDCGVDKVIRDGYSALIAKNNDSVDLAHKVSVVINNDKLRNTIAQNAAEDARKNWGLDTTFRQYFSLYDSYLANKKSYPFAARFGGKKAFLKYIYFAIKGFFNGYRSRYGQLANIPGRVVFVCKGNICRSAFAEWYFKKHSDFPCVSLGVDTTSGVDANARIHTLAADIDVDLSGHKTTAINDFTAQNGDLYVCMEPDHIEKLSVIKADKEIVLLGLFTSPTAVYIHDPYSSADFYAQTCLKQIAFGVDNLIAHIEKLRSSKN